MIDLSNMRYRIDDTSQPSFATMDGQDPIFDGNWNVTGYSPVHTSTETGWTGAIREIYERANPSWRRRMRQGEVILSEMLLKVAERYYTPRSLTIGPTAEGMIHNYAGDIMVSVAQLAPQSPLDLYLDGPKMRELALTKATAKAKSAAVLSPEILSDLDKTVGMLKRPCKGGQDLIKRMFKSRNRSLGKTASSAAKATSGAWLEYRYGWKPLILDMETIIKEAHGFRESLERRRLVVRAGETNENRFSGVLPRTIISGGSYPWYVAATNLVEQSAKVGAGVICDLANRTTSERMEQMLGYRPSDFLQTFWEVIPYSFVVDWFVNVGDWLQAVTPDPMITIVGNWTTFVFKRTKTLSCTSYEASTTWWPSHPVTYGQGGSSVETYTEVCRECNRLIPFTPDLTVKSLSRLRQADAVSLLNGSIIDSLRKFKH